MVSAGVCFNGKGRLHFISEKAKVNAKLYVNTLPPKLFADCKTLLPAGFIFQQDGGPAHTARMAQDWIATNCTGFIGKDEWPPNSPDLNPLDCAINHCFALLNSYVYYNVIMSTRHFGDGAFQKISETDPLSKCWDKYHV